jgi:hypothetical protein
VFIWRRASLGTRASWRFAELISSRVYVWGVISAIQLFIFNYAIGNCIYEVQLCYYDIRYYVIRISFGVKQSLLKFHSVWNSHYWNSHSAWHSETKIQLPVRHGTQKPKLDFRFSGKSMREIVIIIIIKISKLAVTTELLWNYKV